MANITINKLNKSYFKGQPVLKDLDLHIRNNERFFLLGPSGCGKSTLLRILAGLLEPDSGEILYNDRNILELPPEKRRSPMVFQNYALWPHLTVFENVAMPLAAAKISKTMIKVKVNAALKMVKLESLADRRPAGLSGGQQQRVALARCLALDSDILLLDEPLSNLDAQLRDLMRNELTKLCQENHLTSLYVTHDRKEALSMADRAAVLNGGILQQTGTPRELYYRPLNTFVADFLGLANYLNGEYSHRTGDHYFYNTNIGLVAANPGLTSTVKGKKVRLMIRPEHIREALPTQKDNCYNSEIVSGSFLGETQEWILDLAPDCSFVFSEAGAPERKLNKPLKIYLAPENLLALEK